VPHLAGLVRPLKLSLTQGVAHAPLDAAADGAGALQQDGSDVQYQ
jgi:hypothetical protein